MKRLTLLFALIAFTLNANGQVSLTAQTDRVDVSIEVMDNINTVLSYSTQNGLGEYVSVGAKYRNQINIAVFSVQGQYGIGTFTQPREQTFLTDQKEFEFVFSYSAFGGVNISDFDIGISLNQHLGENRDIWISPTVSYQVRL